MKNAPLIFGLFLLTLPPLFGEPFPVEFVKISEKFLVHRSYALYEGTKTPSNGLIVIGNDSVLLVDTAWTNSETDEILEYIATKLKKKVVACFITHFHQDRSGGLDRILANQIPVYMTAKTSHLLKDKYPHRVPQEGRNEFGSIGVDLAYFGPAHSVDNMCAYFADERVLFGGCLVKSMESRTMGNTADADVKNWPRVIRAIQNRYREVKVIIPGHGDVGGPELLAHTLEVVE